MKRGTIISVLIVTGAAVIIVAGTWILQRGDGVDTTEAQALLRVASARVPIADAEPILEGPDLYLGVVSAQPIFDTEALGPDLSLVMRVDDIDPLDPEEALRGVYLGHDPAGSPYYIWQSGYGDFWELIGQVVADFGTLGRFESSFGTLLTGRDIDPDGMGTIAGSIASSTGSPTTLVAEWHGLPDEVAAVAFYLDADPIGWQIPVSGTVAIQHELAAEEDLRATDMFMVAMDARGDEWGRQMLFEASLPTTPAP